MTKLKLILLAAVATCVLGSTETLAQNAYITNQGPPSTVSVIDTERNAVTATIPVSPASIGVAVSGPNGKVYVTSLGDNTVSVIDPISNKVTDKVLVGSGPVGVAVTPNGNAVYVANIGDNTVSVIDATKNVVASTIPGGIHPYGVAVSPDGSTVYVANEGGSVTLPSPPATISVINTATNTVTTTITIDTLNADVPAIAVSPDGSKVYVTNEQSPSMAVIDTKAGAVTATIPVVSASAVAVSPDGSKVYVTNGQRNVLVIDAATNAVTDTISVQAEGLLWGVAVTPDGSKVYSANEGANSVAAISTASNKVIATIPVGVEPFAFGVFIRPTPKFAGTSGKADCCGKSVSALAQQHGGLNNTAAALGYPSVSALQNAIEDYCEA